MVSRLPPVGLRLGFSSESGLAGLGRRSTASRPAPHAGPEDRSGSATAPAGATRLGSPMRHPEPSGNASPRPARPTACR